MSNLATRDYILASGFAMTRYDERSVYVIGDNHCAYTALAADAGTGRTYAYAESGASTGLVVLVTETGCKSDNAGRVRVRVDFPRDTGDLLGTLSFDAGHIGGRGDIGAF